MAESARRYKVLRELGLVWVETEMGRLNADLESVRQIRDRDMSHYRECMALLSEHDRLARDAASLLLGIADMDFQRYDDQFRLRFHSFDRCTSEREIEEALTTLRRSVAEMSRIVNDVRSTQKEFTSLSATYRELDAAAVAADPHAYEIYIEISELLSKLKERLDSGELERSGTFVTKITEGIDFLRRHVEQETEHAAIELDLWRILAAQCPTTMASFSEQLARMPIRPNGEDLEAWIRLRRSIETSVNRSASETRSTNSKTLGNGKFRYDWLDPNKARLPRFARHSLQSWRKVVYGPVPSEVEGQDS